MAPLWAAYLEKLEWLPGHRRVRIVARLHEINSSRAHELVLEGVSSIRYTDEWADPVDKLEMTELYLDPVRDGRWRLDVVLWSEETRLMVDFERAILDGLPVDAAEA
jgi:hypothetical protein